MTRRLRERILRYARALVQEGYWPVVRRRKDYELQRAWHTDISSQANPLLRAGAKYFSQFDEDGIVLEILNRLRLERGRFLEIGVGDGTENNTIILMARGWSGDWLGGEPLAWAPSGRRLRFRQTFVTAENVVEQLSDGQYDIISVDVDGNDYWIAEKILEAKYRPAVVVVEYNPKFPPPVSFVMPYNHSHTWDGSDYFGASLAAWAELLARYNYRLVCCSYMGTNAFFVRESSLDAFADIPRDPSVLYRPAMYAAPFHAGHPTSPRTLAHLERQETALER